MTRREEILEAFRKNGYCMTLGHMLCYPWGYEFRARATELRKEGYVILCERGEKPSDNRYTMIPPEDTGQMRFA